MTTTKQERLIEIRGLQTGMPRYCTGMTFILGGKTVTVDQVVTMANDLIAADAATTQAKAGYTAAVAAERDLIATNGGTIREIRENLALIFSNAPQTLAGLAIAPRKTPTPLSAEAAVAKEAKAKATRAARGTTSKKQKATVHGSVTGVTITPNVTGTVVASTTPAAPAATPTAQSPATGNGATVGLGGASRP